MQRVMIIGSAGSGKSTLAVRLGEATGLPVIHIDRLYWRDNWERRDPEEYRRLLIEAASAESWIIDGSYSSTFPQRLARADTLIFLDLPTRLCVQRALLRSLRYYGRTRPDMPEGCPERFDWSFVKWIVGYRTRTRPGVLDLIREAPERLRVHHLRSQRDVRRFLKACAAAPSMSS